MISANQFWEFCFSFWAFSQVACLYLLFPRKKEGETTALARRNVAAGGVPSTPSSVVPCTSRLPVWHLEFLENCLCSYSSLRADVCRRHVKSCHNNFNEHRALLRRFPACCQKCQTSWLLSKTWKPCSTFWVSYCQSILLNKYPKDNFRAVWLWLQCKAIKTFLSPLDFFSSDLFLEMWACALPALPPVLKSSPMGNTSSVKFMQIHMTFLELIVVDFVIQSPVLSNWIGFPVGHRFIGYKYRKGKYLPRCQKLCFLCPSCIRSSFLTM